MKNFEVHIPWGVNGNLAEAYNLIMKQAQTDWVLLLDHDIFFCNPHWYQICQIAIEQAEKENCGLISCVTNRNGSQKQKSFIINNSFNILDHIKLAKELYEKFGNKLIESEPPLAGYFFLVNKKIWENIGGFCQVIENKVEHIDGNFSDRLYRNKYKLLILQGLYVFHLAGLRKLKWAKDKKNN